MMTTESFENVQLLRDYCFCCNVRGVFKISLLLKPCLSAEFVIIIIRMTLI